MMGTELLISMIFSTIGAGYFIYGKKQAEASFMLAGAVLAIYSYFISDLVPMTLIGVTLMAAPFIAQRLFDL